MTRRSRLLLALLLGCVALAPLPGVVGAASAVVDGYSSWNARAERVGGIGGRSWSYDAWSAVMSATGDAHEVTFTVSNYQAPVWRASFQAPTGAELLAGAAYPLTGAHEPSVDTGVMSVDADHLECNFAVGQLTVDQATYDETGAVTSFAGHFRVSCPNDEPRFLGSFASTARDPAVPLPPAPTEPVQALSVSGGLDDAVLHWSNPDPAFFATTMVRAARGRIPPATPHDGWRVYTGRSDQVLARLWQGYPFSFSVFTVGEDGTVAGPVSGRLDGTEMAIYRARDPRETVLAIRLTDTDGQGVAGAHVALYRRWPHATHWRPITGWLTDARGRGWSGLGLTRHAAWYRAVFDGAGPDLGSVSSEIFVRGTRT